MSTLLVRDCASVKCLPDGRKRRLGLCAQQTPHSGRASIKSVEQVTSGVELPSKRQLYHSNIHEPGSFENCYALGGITEPKKWWSMRERDIRVPKRLNRT